MTEIELNEGITTILDAEQTAIKSKQGLLTLRDVLTAVHLSQQLDTRWISKFVGKKFARPETIILHLPHAVGKYISTTEGGTFLGFYNQLCDALNLLTELQLLKMKPIWHLNEETDEFEAVDLYGVTNEGKAFVNYNEV